jgi:hypothetical protein
MILRNAPDIMIDSPSICLSNTLDPARRAASARVIVWSTFSAKYAAGWDKSLVFINPLVETSRPMK